MSPPACASPLHLSIMDQFLALLVLARGSAAQPDTRKRQEGLAAGLLTGVVLVPEGQMWPQTHCCPMCDLRRSTFQPPALA